MIQVTTPTTEQMDEVRDLMRAFVDWHRQRHQEDLRLIDMTEALIQEARAIGYQSMRLDTSIRQNEDKFHGAQPWPQIAKVWP